MGHTCSCQPLLAADDLDVEASSTSSCEDEEAEEQGEASASDALTREALASCRSYLNIGDVFSAEKALLGTATLLISRGQTRRAALNRLVRTKEFTSTKAMLQKLDRVATDVLAAGSDAEWSLAAEVPIDYRALGLEVDEDTAAELHAGRHNIIKILYRLNGKQVEMRFDTALPTYMPGGLPSLVGWVAMWAETQLWHTWNPTVLGLGPVELRPRGLFKNTWHTLSSIMFKRIVSLQESFAVCDHAAVAHALVIEGKGAEDPQWRQHPPPQGFGIADDVVTLRALASPGRRTTYLGMVITAESRVALPEMLLKFCLKRILPETARKMMAAIASACAGAGPHHECISRDEHGTYKECWRLVAGGAEHDIEARREMALRSRLRGLAALAAQVAELEEDIDIESVSDSSDEGIDFDSSPKKPGTSGRCCLQSRCCFPIGPAAGAGRDDSQ